MGKQQTMLLMLALIVTLFMTIMSVSLWYMSSAASSSPCTCDQYGVADGGRGRQDTASATATFILTTSTLESLLAMHKKSLVFFGHKATNTGWYVDTLCVDNKESLLAYGVGAGADISWDTGLVDEYGATVYMFDPTEKSIKYTAPIVAKYASSHPSHLFHTPEGLSNKQGELTFALPANPNDVSMRQTDMATANMQRTATVQVNTLRNWMVERQHDYLDILKIDIEGSEYDVLEDLLEQDFLPFTQLLVEYHDRFLANKARHTALLRALTSAGFRELWSQHEGQEVGYVKVADLPYCADGKFTRNVRATPVLVVDDTIPTQ